MTSSFTRIEIACKGSRKPQVYTWQMNDGRWHISASGARASAAILDDSMWIYRAGLDRGFETAAEAHTALYKAFEEVGR